MADAGTAPTMDPLPDDVDVSGILDNLKSGFAGVQNSIASSLSDLTNIIGPGGSAAQTKSQQAAGIMQAASGQVQVSDIQEAHAIDLKAANSGAIAAISTNRDASSQLLAALSTNIVGQQKDLDARASMINQKLDANFMDDPLQWIANKFTLPLDIASYNARQSEFTQRQQTMQSTEALVNKDAADIATIDTSDSVQLAAAKRTQILGKAQADVAQSNYEMAGLGIQGLNIRNAMNMDQFNATDRLYDSVVQSRRLILEGQSVNLQGQELKVHQQYNDIMNKYRLTQDADNANRLQDTQQFQSALDLTTAKLGMPKISVGQLGHYLPARRDAILSAVSSLQSNPDGTITLGGPTPVQAMIAVQNGNFPLAPGARKTYDYLKNTADGFVAGQAEQWKALDPQVKAQMINDAVVKKVAAEENNIPASGGLFSPPPLAAVINSTAFKNLNLPAVPEIAALAQANPAHPTDANELVRIMAMKINSGGLTVEQASNYISKLYTQVKIDNEFQHQYTMFSVVPPTDFKTQVDTGNQLFRKTAVIDMTNPAQVKNALLQFLIAQKIIATQNAAAAISGVGTVGP